MPHRFSNLEEQILRAFEQALADNRLDVADHLFYALEALDPEFEGAALRRACRSILHATDEAPLAQTEETRVH
ncbi:hypothetical protein [Microvirga sp. VF16]|uniref:hypothetical protein n=1 Tax=Microvirga sp. VF16 TaxID=2807101 RepID=UPI00193D2085|nr:hypothetical protein [Microvirga sp. VF16]QRM34704.1 hypothetical protein JO965_41240 [Microvirga sp. VF16]